MTIMDDIRLTAKELFDDLEKIKSGDLKKKVKLQEQMKKIMELSDEEISSKELEDQEKKIISLANISSVYSFFIKYPEFEEKVRNYHQ
jgi:uncharacterized protein (UPF0305 family)